jgi:hypothetical protein
MFLKFPFVPKSNAQIEPGHFWPIKLLNGKFGCGIILDVPADKKADSRNIYAGLLNWTGDLPPTEESLESGPLKTLDEGFVHIKTITIQEEAIQGYLDLTKNNLIPQLQVDSENYSNSSSVLRGFSVVRSSTPIDHTQLNTESTWGYEVIIATANKLLQ